MEFKTVFKASISGSVEPKYGRDSEAYIVTVVYSDGSKRYLQKTYEQFVDLQCKVYYLLNYKGGYSRKTSRTLVSSLPETSSPLGRIFFKNDELKKMEKIEQFLKELLTLPKMVTDSEEVMEFFNSSNDKQEPNDRLEEDEKLKRINKMIETLRHLSLQQGARSSSECSSGGESRSRKNMKFSEFPSQDSERTEDSDEVISMSSELAAKLQQVSVILDDLDSHKQAKSSFRRHLRGTISQKKPSPQDSHHHPYAPKPSDKCDKKRASSTGDISLEQRNQPRRSELRKRKTGVASMTQTRLKLHEKTAAVKMQSSNQAGITKARHVPQLLDSDIGSNSPTKNILLQEGDEVEEEKCDVTKVKCIAISSLTAEEHGEVSLEVGEDVEVLRRGPRGWCYVKTDDCEGWAPLSFLKLVAPSRSVAGNLEDEESVYQAEDDQDSGSEPFVCVEPGTGDYEDDLTKPTENRKNLESLPDNGIQSKSRRCKFLVVEGIQKQKNPKKNYVYILRVVWSDGTINIIYRKCSDFFFLQENLKQEFPNGTGNEIPVLQGRKFAKDCQFCLKDGTCKRRQFINHFCYQLINASEEISQGDTVLSFCRPRPSDVIRHEQINKDRVKKKSKRAIDKDIQISEPMTFEQYVVIAEYIKKNKNDISLNAGDIVDVIEKNYFGWWLVDIEGELGWAPASHLEPVEDASEITTKRSYSSGKEEIYISLRNYEAEADDEMSFDAGVMLEVTEKTLDGWWYVKNQNQKGWAPAVFLKKVKPDDASSWSVTSGKLGAWSFYGDSNGKEVTPRSPPKRRSTVKRTISRKPKRISSLEEHRRIATVFDDNDHTKRSRSISVPSMLQGKCYSKPLSRRGEVCSSVQPPGPPSDEFSMEDTNNLPRPKRRSSPSSGYGTSPYSSICSLESQSPSDSSKESDSLPEFDDDDDSAIQSPVMPLLQSVPLEATELETSKSKSHLVAVSPLQSPDKSSSASILPGNIRSGPALRKYSRNIPFGGSLQNLEGMESLTCSKAVPRQRKAVVKDPEDVPFQFENLDDVNKSVVKATERRIETSKCGISLPGKRNGSSRTYRALYSYISTEDGEISFQAGDEVEVIQRSDNGWWLVRTANELGWGPSNFLTAF